jgi:hypothetical protein
MLLAIGHILLSRRHQKLRGFHDQAVFIKPPVVNIKLPTRRGDIARFLQQLVKAKPNTNRPRVNPPEAPSFCTGARRCTSWRKLCDVLRWNTAVRGLGIERASNAGCQQSKRRQEPLATGEIKRMFQHGLKMIGYTPLTPKPEDFVLR